LLFFRATIKIGMHLNVTFTRILRVLLLYTNVIRNEWRHTKWNEIKYAQLTWSYLAMTLKIKLRYSTFILRDTEFSFLYMYFTVCSADCAVELWRCGSDKGLIVDYNSTQSSRLQTPQKFAVFYPLLTAFKAWMICLRTDLHLLNLWNQRYYLSM